MEERIVKAEELMTIPAMVGRSAELFGEKIAFQMRRGGEFERFSFGEVNRRVRAIAAALMSTGFKKGEKAGVIGENRPEWPISYFAIVTAGGIVVPLDPQLKHKELGHILSISGTNVVFASPHFIPVLSECTQSTGFPRTIICMEEDGGSANSNLDDFVKKGQECIDRGKVNLAERMVELDDLLAIIFTSGTTGKSKGVMLTHRNVVFDTIAASKVIQVLEGDGFISVLPLHHTFEATAGFFLPFYMGAMITYARSLKSKEIIEDLKDSKATILLGVPLLYEKMLKAIHRGMAEQSGFIKVIIKTNLAFVRSLKKLFHSEAGKVLFRSLRKKAGLETLRIMISGGAALPLWVCKSFRELGFNLFQGYGLTETSPVTNANPLEKIKPASVGPPIPGIEMKIVQPDEKGIGEIAVRGPIVMRGYFQDMEETAKVLKEGWFYTGDIGWVDSDNYYYITGRKKSVIVSAAGKNIYPEEVEEELLVSDFIEEVLVTGRINPDTKREEVHAIIYPNWETLDIHSKELGIEQSDRWINEFFREEIEGRCRELSDYKRVKSFSIREEEFPKTTTKKIKRFLFQEDVLRAN
jgi:long-chain acyl-CoA synthetase